MNAAERARLVPAPSEDDVRQQFRDYRAEITKPQEAEESAPRRSRQTEGNGTAENVATHRPAIGDEFSNAARGIAADSRNDRMLMAAVGIAALTQRQQEEEDHAKRQQAQQQAQDPQNEPRPAQGRRIEDVEPQRPDYRALDENGRTQAQQDRDALTGPQPSSGRQASPEDEQRRADMAQLVNPERHAEVQQQEAQRSQQRQRTYQNSLSM